MFDTCYGYLTVTVENVSTSVLRSFGVLILEKFPILLIHECAKSRALNFVPLTA